MLSSQEKSPERQVSVSVCPPPILKSPQPNSKSPPPLSKSMVRMSPQKRGAVTLLQGQPMRPGDWESLQHRFPSVQKEQTRHYVIDKHLIQ